MASAKGSIASVTEKIKAVVFYLNRHEESSPRGVNAEFC